MGVFVIRALTFETCIRAHDFGNSHVRLNKDQHHVEICLRNNV